MAMTGKGIVKLVEETGELQEVLGKLQQLLGKMLAYGVDSHPDGTQSLLEKFEQECADVKAASDFVAAKLGANTVAIEERRSIKLARYNKWDRE